jgi:hypothetical protein
VENNNSLLKRRMRGIHVLSHLTAMKNVIDTSPLSSYIF